MSLIETLEKRYGYNVPILANELSIEGMSAPGIRQALSRLSKQGYIERYAQGVYYIPKQTPFGKSRLSAKKVYEKKYILNETDVYGYYSGLTLTNAIGLTTQMPNVIEIVTNEESSRVREVSLGNQKLRLRKSRVKIDSSNADTLQFLDLMNQVNPKALTEEERQVIIAYIKTKAVKKAYLLEYVSYFPSRVAKNLIESGIADELA